MLQKMILAENWGYFSRHDFVIESSIPRLDAQLKGYTFKISPNTVIMSENSLENYA